MSQGARIAARRVGKGAHVGQDVAISLERGGKAIWIDETVTERTHFEYVD
jgi:hypothetical protein